MYRKIGSLLIGIGLIMLMVSIYISFNPGDEDPFKQTQRYRPANVEISQFYTDHWGYDKTVPRIIDTQEFKQAYYQ